MNMMIHTKSQIAHRLKKAPPGSIVVVWSISENTGFPVLKAGFGDTVVGKFLRKHPGYVGHFGGESNIEHVIETAKGKANSIRKEDINKFIFNLSKRLNIGLNPSSF